MIRRLIPLALIIGLLSLISGKLMSRPSLIGRVGIDLFYKEYRFLRTWWQGALSIFAVLLIFLVIQGVVHYKWGRRKAAIIHTIAILLAITGFYFTYQDFHHTTTHRWLKEGFHIGAYLFWVGWIVISLFFIFLKHSKKHITEPEHAKKRGYPVIPGKE